MVNHALQQKTAATQPLGNSDSPSGRRGLASASVGPPRRPARNQGQWVQGRAQAWKNALKRAELENFRRHNLRHTWASWLVQNGTPLNVVQEMGAWESEGMVRRYAHLPRHNWCGMQKSSLVCLTTQLRHNR